MVTNRLANQLSEQGFAISHIDEIFNSQQKEMYDLMDQYYKNILAKGKIQKHLQLIAQNDIAQLKKMTPRNKYYYLTQIEMLGRSLGIEPQIPLVDMYTQDVFLDVTAAYLGKEPRIFNVITYIHPAAPGMTRTASQNWHRDSEDAHQVKAFIYFNDVGPKQGALQIVSGTSHPVNTPINPKEKFNATTLCGKKGSIVFFDGTNIHRGGWIEQDMRLMTQALYLRPDAKMVKNGFYNSFQRNGKTNNVNFKSVEFKALSERAKKCLN